MENNSLFEKHKERLIKLSEIYHIDFLSCTKEIKRNKKNIELRFECPYTNKVISRQIGSMERMAKCKKCKLKNPPCLMPKVIETPVESQNTHIEPNYNYVFVDNTSKPEIISYTYTGKDIKKQTFFDKIRNFFKRLF